MTAPVAGLAIEQQPEEVIVRLCLWSEARGEGPIGMLAVWHVVHNRAVKRDSTMKEEVLRPLQFSAFNQDDPNRHKMLNAWLQDKYAWSMADAVASLAETGATQDVTHGSTHYYNPAVCSPPWGRGHAGWHEFVTIGKHVFGRAA